MKWMNECIWYNVQINIIADSILNNLNLLFLLFLLSLNIVNFNDNNFTTQSLDDRNWRLLKHTDALVTRYPCVRYISTLCRSCLNAINAYITWYMSNMDNIDFWQEYLDMATKKGHSTEERGSNAVVVVGDGPTYVSVLCDDPHFPSH